MPQLRLYSPTPGPTTTLSNSPAGQRTLGTAFKSSVNTNVLGGSWWTPTSLPASDPIMSLWSIATVLANTGTQLASQSKAKALLTTGAANDILFGSPFPITANLWYVIQLWTSDNYTFSNPNPWPRVNGTLSSADGTNAGGNGRFNNGAASNVLAQFQSGSTGFDFFVDVITDVGGVNNGAGFLTFF